MKPLVVIGDSMLDIDVEGSASRLSPEAPVPVVDPDRIWQRPGGARVILTQRSPQLKHHPGQVAFAGGKVDADDDGPIAAALREAQEEIALPPDHVEVLGTLPAHETVTGFRVLPVNGLPPWKSSAASTMEVQPDYRDLLALLNGQG